MTEPIRSQLPGFDNTGPRRMMKISPTLTRISSRPVSRYLPRNCNAAIRATLRDRRANFNANCFVIPTEVEESLAVYLLQSRLGNGVRCLDSARHDKKDRQSGVARSRPRDADARADGGGPEADDRSTREAGIAAHRGRIA